MHQCECGGTYERNKARHERTQKHESYMLKKKAEEARMLKQNSVAKTANQTGSASIETKEAEGFLKCDCGGNISKNYPICRHRNTAIHKKYVAEHPGYITITNKEAVS